MEKIPKVSVVIPAYNEEKWIGKTLEAILTQDYPDYEIIIVDNASTDSTSQIVRGFTNPKIRLLNENRKGILFARELGRIHATGEIIAQLDADCHPKNNWITQGVHLLENKKNVAVTGPYYFYDVPLWMNILANFGQLFHKLMSVFVQKIKHRGLLIGGNSFIRKEILDLVNGYNTGIDFYGEDTDTAGKIAPYGWIKYSYKITMPTSGRRLKHFGFWKLNKIYTNVFWNTINKKMKLEDSQEHTHPR